MQGTLADLDLASLAAVTSLGRSSLRLEVSDPTGGLIGHLVLKAGRVVSATAGEVHGRHAMRLIMRSTASTRFRLVHEPLDYVLSSALASVGELAELAELGKPRLARSSEEATAIEARRGARRPTSQSGSRIRMMQGRLDEFDLPTLLQVIAMGRSYVELEILNETGTKVGIVGVKAGHIVAARTRDRKGIEAISELMSSPKSFEFLAFRIDVELGPVEALGSVAEILVRSQAPAPRPPSPHEPAPPAEAVPIMEGSLSEFDVPMLLQTAACGRQHCALEVFDDDRVVGTIHVKSGIVVSAIAGTLTALPAIERLVGLQAPHRFRLNRITAEIGDHAPVGSISQVLLQLDSPPVPSHVPPPVAPPPSADFEQDMVTASPPLPATAPPGGHRDRGGPSSVAELLPVMEGNLADFDIRTLLEALAVTRQHSYLQVLDRSQALIGELRIKAGMMISARASGHHGVDALKFLLGISPHVRFRVLTGVFDVDAPPLGSIHELLAVFAPRLGSPPERASRVIRAAIPISFFFGGAIVFFMLRGGGPAATLSRERPVTQLSVRSPAEVAAKEPRPAFAPPAPPPPPASPPPEPPSPAAGQAGSPPSPVVNPATPRAAEHEGTSPRRGEEVDPAAKHLEIGPTPDSPVHVGMRIQTAQMVLKHLGYDPGPIDNVYGALTRIAISKFQGDHALPRTAVLDDETWSAIVALLTRD
jgi:hypothetical protein